MKLRVGDMIPVNVKGSVVKAKIRRIGASDPTYGGFVMLTLDVGGQVGYTAARETDIAADEPTEVAAA